MSKRKSVSSEELQIQGNKKQKLEQTKFCILGAGNIGLSILGGLSAKYEKSDFTLSRRNLDHLRKYEEQGYEITTNNVTAMKEKDIIIISVGPNEIEDLISEIKDKIDYKNQIIVSIVLGKTVEQLSNLLGSNSAKIIRCLPNTAASVCESMTCLCINKNGTKEQIEALNRVESVFQRIGRVKIIPEELMIASTALVGCAVAFFLRAIRAAAQGGVEIGFSSEDALLLAAQTAKGASSLLLTENKTHPEAEIDKVTTPLGCTITGLNKMEHEGFSSAFIHGIVCSAEKANSIKKKE